MKLAPYDELNRIREFLEARRADWNPERKPGQAVVRECIDEVIDLLIMAYVYGRQDAMETLDEKVPITAKSATEMQKALFAEVAGETFEQRITTYMEDFDVEAIMRVIESEITRDYAAGGMDTAKAVERKGVSVKKTWNTVGDERVRDTHEPLHGITLDLDSAFVTYDGDSAMAPGGFTLAENNVNCRCWLTYAKGA